MFAGDEWAALAGDGSWVVRWSLRSHSEPRAQTAIPLTDVITARQHRSAGPSPPWSGQAKPLKMNGKRTSQFTDSLCPLHTLWQSSVLPYLNLTVNPLQDGTQWLLLSFPQNCYCLIALIFANCYCRLYGFFYTSSYIVCCVTVLQPITASRFWSPEWMFCAWILLNRVNGSKTISVYTHSIINRVLKYPTRSV